MEQLRDVLVDQPLSVRGIPVLVVRLDMLVKQDQNLLGLASANLPQFLHQRAVDVMAEH